MYLRDKLDIDGKTPEGPPSGTSVRRLTEQDPFSLDALIAWLKTKPADKEYCWADGGRCLFSQYGEAIGLGSGSNGYVAFLSGLAKRGRNTISFECDIAYQHPRTFGAALSRALALRGAA